ncbi:MAG: hypothetical protein NC200_00885 [Candidatus Gastranaerophilales bacterium]|nr:hypothetical protein [Candidatus Gastranaerophilales bacterium]MCM1338883.1 hypothetical protein [Muribaculaceae bacterium]
MRKNVLALTGFLICLFSINSAYSATQYLQQQHENEIIQRERARVEAIKREEEQIRQIREDRRQRELEQNRQPSDSRVIRFQGPSEEELEELRNMRWGG